MMIRRLTSGLAVLAALNTSGCCETPDFSLPDFRGRLGFGGSVAFDFDFDVDMEFDFDGDFSGWANLDVVTAASLGIDVDGKVAYEQEIEIDIDDDGVEETVSVLGFGDGDADDVDTIVAAWEGDEYTFDEDYCYVLVITEDTVTLITGPCNSDSPGLTCTSPADDLDDVSCSVCDENGDCAECESNVVAECIDEGSDALDDREPEPEAEPEPEPVSMPDAGLADGDAGVPETSPDAAAPPVDGGAMTMTPEPMTPDPDVTASPQYQSCLQQVSTLEASVALCGLSLTVDADTLCQTSLDAVGRCFSGIDGLGFLDNPCSVLESNECSEIVQ